jgi:hypothetical protein
MLHHYKLIRMCYNKQLVSCQNNQIMLRERKQNLLNTGVSYRFQILGAGPVQPIEDKCQNVPVASG